MRRFFLGLAIVSLTASAPATAFGGDREIADQIISLLKQQQTAGSLKGFDIDLSVEEGVVTLTGFVANSGQAAAVIEAAKAAAGVRQVTSNIEVREATTMKGSEANGSVKPASDTQAGKPLPVTIGGYTPEKEDVSSTVALPEPPPMESAEALSSPQDAAITDEALRRLSQAKSQGELRNFELDLSTVEGEVWVRGVVINPAHKDLVLRTVQRVPGVTKVIDDITVGARSASAVKPASDMTPAAPMAASMPVVGTGAAPTPRAFAPSSVVGYEGEVVYEGSVPGAVAGESVVGGYGSMPTPVPMNMGPSYGAGVPRYDQPQMPGYAWPSYAAYPNYAAVTYPKQYSATAWPYIGPFYPYPQVPLGWRKVALEWDDGLWYLDFTRK